MAGGIEEAIFNNIESATGETFDDTPVEQGNDEGQQQQAQPDKDVELDEATRQLRAREQDDLTDPLGKRQQQQPDKKAQPNDKDKNPKRNERGDLVDANGNVIAASGPERRLNAQVGRLREVNNGLKQQNDQLVSQLAEVRTLNGMPERLGFKNDDVLELFEFGVAFKNNPAQGAKKAIELALAKGANLRDIISEDSIPNLSLEATRQLLDARLGPVQQERQGREAVDIQAREAQTKSSQFLADYPEAEPHSEVIADHMRRIMQEYNSRGVNIDPYIAAERALNDLQAFAQKHGLDFSQPLGHQWQARQTRTPSGANNNPAVQQRRPMPNGTPVSTRGTEVVERKSRSANPDDSFNSIVRDAMIESGYTF